MKSCFSSVGVEWSIHTWCFVSGDIFGVFANFQYFVTKFRNVMAIRRIFLNKFLHSNIYMRFVWHFRQYIKLSCWLPGGRIMSNTYTYTNSPLWLDIHPIVIYTIFIPLIMIVNLNSLAFQLIYARGACANQLSNLIWCVYKHIYLSRYLYININIHIKWLHIAQNKKKGMSDGQLPSILKNIYLAINNSLNVELWHIF